MVQKLLVQITQLQTNEKEITFKYKTEIYIKYMNSIKLETENELKRNSSIKSKLLAQLQMTENEIILKYKTEINKIEESSQILTIYENKESLSNEELYKKLKANKIRKK